MRALYLILLGVSSALALLGKQSVSPRLHTSPWRQIHWRLKSVLSAAASSSKPEISSDQEPAQKYIDELARLQEEYTHLDSMVKSLRSTFVKQNTGSKYVLEALENVEDLEGAFSSTLFAPSKSNKTIMESDDESGLSKVLVEKCGVLTFSLLTALCSWLAFARLWLLGGCIGAIFAYRNIDEKNLGGKFYRCLGRRTALLPVHRGN